MEDRAEMLRRRIEAYRRRLAEGVGLQLAQFCLAGIARDQAELDRNVQRDEQS